MIATARTTYYLTVRALRETVRQPAFEVQNIFIPLFFLAVTSGAIGQISGQAFGVDNYVAFALAVAISRHRRASSSAGLGMVMDIDRGYFDKLLLTPAPRLSLVMGGSWQTGLRSCCWPL
jgi:ABC-2 type transport system permease protein